MNDLDHPIQSVKYLLKATAVSLALAGLLLVIAILPAEFGIDPTGLGKKMGLLALAPAEEAEDQSNSASCGETLMQRNDTVTVIIPPLSGLEYKFILEKGAALRYTWKTDGGKLYFDFHGEPKGDTTGYFKSYEENTLNQTKGIQTIPFDGNHGWYWKNDTAKPISVTLTTRGRYRILGVR
ncbi:MAG: hypothetical protein A6F71_00705 [Cycloclasticus sp. symbiont of Poecilosclerida sp. M]|nr:MAG: hypothetical protein A6F71_00705 [Cycloclasticus sp. symbiont of Poecilosclerida sp. M]